MGSRNTVVRPGDLLLYCAHDPVSWIIRLATCAPVNHVAIVAPDAQSCIAATTRGVRRCPLPDLASPDIWRWPAPQPQGMQAAAWAERQLGRPYGWLVYLGLLERLLHIDLVPWHWFRRFLVCSTLATLAWRAAGLDPAPGLEAALVVPGDLFMALARVPAQEVLS